MIKVKTIGQMLPFKKRHGFAQSIAALLDKIVVRFALTIYPYSLCAALIKTKSHH
jgi:hypothetical protein